MLMMNMILVCHNQEASMDKDQMSTLFPAEGKRMSPDYLCVTSRFHFPSYLCASVLYFSCSMFFFIEEKEEFDCNDAQCSPCVCPEINNEVRDEVRTYFFI